MKNKNARKISAMLMTSMDSPLPPARYSCRLHTDVGNAGLALARRVNRVWRQLYAQMLKNNVVAASQKEAGLEKL